MRMSSDQCIDGSEITLTRMEEALLSSLASSTAKEEDLTVGMALALHKSPEGQLEMIQFLMQNRTASQKEILNKLLEILRKLPPEQMLAEILPEDW